VLRAAGIAAEVFPEAKKLGKQLQYADRKGFLVAIIAGENEFAQGTWQVKNLKAGNQTTVPESDLVETVREVLGN
jgi:histidyl-tRNA synthetase